MTFIDVSLLQSKGNNIYYYDAESLTLQLSTDLAEVIKATRTYYDDFTEGYVTKNVPIKEANAVLINNNIAFE